MIFKTSTKMHYRSVAAEIIKTWNEVYAKRLNALLDSNRIIFLHFFGNNLKNSEAYNWFATMPKNDNRNLSAYKINLDILKDHYLKAVAFIEQYDTNSITAQNITNGVVRSWEVLRKSPSRS